jgi:hypothetical protein
MAHISWIPRGVVGIVMRSAEVHKSLSTSQTPLSSDELWRNVVQPKRGFEARPFDAADRYRGTGRPPHPTLDAEFWRSRLAKNVRGGPLGFGVDTVGSVQLVDASGKRAWIGAGHFVGPAHDLEKHAEACSLRGLGEHAPKRLPGSRLVVVVDQIVCDSCRAKLMAYAKQVGAKSIEIYHPRLENERYSVGSGVMKTPKGSSVSSFRGPHPTQPRPPLIVRLEETIHVPRTPGGGGLGGGNIPQKPGGGGLGKINFAATPGSGALDGTSLFVHGNPGELGPPTLADAHIRTAIKGAVANLAAGVAIMIFQDRFKAYMLDELERMPKPSPDSSKAKEYFSNHHTRNSMRIIDLLNKNVQPFASELAEYHQGVILTAALELSLLDLSCVPDEEKLAFLKGLDDELGAYDADLRVVEDNLEAARRMAPRAIEAAEAAESMSKILERVLVADQLVKTGFSVDEYVELRQFFETYPSRVRGAFQRLDALLIQVTRQRHELADLLHQVNRLHWQTIFGMLANDPRASLEFLPRSPSGPGRRMCGSPPLQESKQKPEAKPKLVPVAPLR